jgi:tartrate-resistant acid phosphatase type 5
MISNSFRCLVGTLVVVLIASCTSVRTPPAATPAARPITLLAFGDTGYHYDYLEAEDYQSVVTEQQFLDKERLDWIDDKRPPAELDFSPMHRLSHNGSVVAASGLAPVAAAMKQYCAHPAGCDFAVMLGDNIYPDGATADADGRDADRFRDLFVTPFGGLVPDKEDFRIYAVLGNHDWRTSRQGAMAQVKFFQSTPPFYMDGLVYRVRPPAAQGEIEIFALDTEVLLSSATVYKARLAEDGSEMKSERVEQPQPWAVPQTQLERNMVQWLDEAMSASTARWKIVIGHHPLWSTSGSKFEQANTLRRLLLPTLCRYADAYLAGHEHTLEVHTDNCSTTEVGDYVEPLPQIVSGSAAKMRPTNTAFIRHQQRNHPALRTWYAKGLTWGFAHLSFERESMTVRIVELPRDGSSATTIAYQQSFVRRRPRAAD